MEPVLQVWWFGLWILLSRFGVCLCWGFLGLIGFLVRAFGWVVVPGVDFVVVLGFWYACFAVVVTGLIVVL